MQFLFLPLKSAFQTKCSNLWYIRHFFLHVFCCFLTHVCREPRQCDVFCLTDLFCFYQEYKSCKHKINTIHDHLHLCLYLCLAFAFRVVFCIRVLHLCFPFTFVTIFVVCLHLHFVFAFTFYICVLQVRFVFVIVLVLSTHTRSTCCACVSVSWIFWFVIFWFGNDTARALLPVRVPSVSVRCMPCMRAWVFCLFLFFAFGFSLFPFSFFCFTFLFYLFCFAS